MLLQMYRNALRKQVRKILEFARRYVLKKTTEELKQDYRDAHAAADAAADDVYDAANAAAYDTAVDAWGAAGRARIKAYKLWRDRLKEEK